MSAPATNAMKGINGYGEDLAPEAIAAGESRVSVGGMWEEIGRLQFQFLRDHGLQPGHALADIGCGCLRGGLHFIDYLDPGRYHGLDINNSLLVAGRLEIAMAGLEGKMPNLLLDDGFRVRRFGIQFDRMLSVSLFTHLPINHILRCLAEARLALKPDGVYYATYFEAPTPLYLEPMRHAPGDVVTYFDQDPFHYGFDEIARMARHAGLQAERIGAWNHPRNQMMAAFRVA